METHLGHTTTPQTEKASNIFFDDPLFEDFTVRALSLDGCLLGEVATTASRIGEGDRDGWYREWSATADRIAAVGEESAIVPVAEEAEGNELGDHQRNPARYRRQPAPPDEFRRRHECCSPVPNCCCPRANDGT